MSKSFVILLSLIVCLQVGSCFQYNESISRKLSKYSFLTYCTPERVLSWTCGVPCQNSEVLQDRVYIKSASENAAIMGYSAQENAIVIAFRGTQKLQNVFQDLSFVRVPYSYGWCTNCWVHSGFQYALSQVQNDIYWNFLKLKLFHPFAKVYLTGHSLGGAMATLLAPSLFEWNGWKKIDAFYTQGSPRVGDETFSDYFTSKDNFAVLSGRVTLNQDPVPQLLPRGWPFGFKHVKNEVFYKNNFFPATLCDMPESNDCQNGNGLALNKDDHLQYFGSNSNDYANC